MGLFWNENKETVSNAELKELIENNAGGTAFKPINYKDLTTGTLPLSTTTKKYYAVGNSSAYITVTNDSYTTETLTINGKSISIPKTKVYYLPMYEKFEISATSSDVYITGSKAGLFEVE